MIHFPSFRSLPRIVQNLLWIHLGVFLIAFLLSAFASSLANMVLAPLFLNPAEPWQIWRWVTYSFLHIDPIHFVFNMLLLWMIGSSVAEWMGERPFLTMYLATGIVAGIFSNLVYWLIQDSSRILGASGALFSVLVAFGWYFPDRQLIFLIFPVPARVAVAMIILLDLFLLPTASNVARVTHLSGAVFALAWLYTKDRLLVGNNRLARFWWNFRKARTHHSKPSVRVLDGEVGYFDEQKQLDALLAKVSRSGVASLSAAELEQLRSLGEKHRLRKGK